MPALPSKRRFTLVRVMFSLGSAATVVAGEAAARLAFPWSVAAGNAGEAAARLVFPWSVAASNADLRLDPKLGWFVPCGEMASHENEAGQHLRSTGTSVGILRQAARSLHSRSARQILAGRDSKRTANQRERRS
jgi:hypothetical protein